MNNAQLDWLLTELCTVNELLDAGALTKGTGELRELKAQQTNLVQQINALLPHGQEVLAQSKVEFERNYVRGNN